MYCFRGGGDTVQEYMFVFGEGRRVGVVTRRREPGAEMSVRSRVIRGALRGVA